MLSAYNLFQYAVKFDRCFRQFVCEAMSDAEQILRIYRHSLDGLKENDKNKINKLTLLAKDHAQIPGFPQKVVEATVRHVYEVCFLLKCTLFFVPHL